MPASKPSTLIKRHETAAEKNARESAENAMNSGRQLPLEAPSRLAKHPVAAKAWRSLLREYTSIEGVIVTRLDLDLLVDYCILIEQTSELDRMRKVAYTTWLELTQIHDQAVKDKDTDSVLQAAVKVVNAFDAVVKLDGRADRKRALLLQMRQSLYLTPRSRAGAAPDPKEKEEPKDELEQLLDEADAIIHGGDQGAK